MESLVADYLASNEVFGMAALKENSSVEYSEVLLADEMELELG